MRATITVYAENITVARTKADEKLRSLFDGVPYHIVNEEAVWMLDDGMWAVVFEASELKTSSGMWPT